MQNTYEALCYAEAMRCITGTERQLLHALRRQADKSWCSSDRLQEIEQSRHEIFSKWVANRTDARDLERLRRLTEEMHARLGSPMVVG